MTEDNDYWTSPDGIAQRVSLLADTYTYRIYNRAIQVYGAKNKAWGFEWIGSTDERTCNRCDMNIGRQYRLGWFMPMLPVHARCRCEWRPITKAERDQIVPMPEVNISKDVTNPSFRKDEISKILTTLPPEHVEGLTNVNIKTQAELGRFKWNEHDDQIAGTYDIQKKELNISQMQTDKVDVIFHEVGHHVYYDIINDETRGRWNVMASQIMKSELPSEYAGRNLSESFAECYQTYQRGEHLPSDIQNFFYKNFGVAAVYRNLSKVQF